MRCYHKQLFLCYQRLRLSCMLVASAPLRSLPSICIHFISLNRNHFVYYINYCAKIDLHLFSWVFRVKSCIVLNSYYWPFHDLCIKIRGSVHEGCWRRGAPCWVMLFLTRPFLILRYLPKFCFILSLLLLWWPAICGWCVVIYWLQTTCAVHQPWCPANYGSESLNWIVFMVECDIIFSIKIITYQYFQLWTFYIMILFTLIRISSVVSLSSISFFLSSLYPLVVCMLPSNYTFIISLLNHHICLNLNHLVAYLSSWKLD